MTIEPQIDYPTYLQSLGDFEAYLADQFQGLNTTARGRQFAEAVLPILPNLPGTDRFAGYLLNPKQSHDQGIDILSQRLPDGSSAVGQSKMKIASTEDLDGIFSKFQVYERDAARPREGMLFDDDPVPNMTYVVVTGSDLDAIRRRYDERRPSSYDFYKQLVASERLIIVDGKDILEWMRKTYTRSTTLPVSFELVSSRTWLTVGEVHIGVLSGQSLVELVRRYGDGLFFENIREWLGSDGDPVSVNNSIIDTIKNEPSRMLERNNGITIRAEHVEGFDGGKTLKISRAAIVNGCQTTMCLWGLRDSVQDSVQVMVKVVEVADADSAWLIAQSANYQNPVGKMELELARYLRPQVVARAAANLGEGLKTGRREGLTAVLQSYTRSEATYSLTRYLFLGLFCRRPNQLFQDNYTNVQIDVVADFFTLKDAEEHLFGRLFAAVRQGREALAAAVDHFADADFAKPFSRLLDADQPKYQAYLILLALCAVVRIDLSKRLDSNQQSAHIYNFLSQADVSIKEKPDLFVRAFLLSYKELARMVARPEEESEKTVHRLNSRVRDASFHDLYSNVCMELNSYEALREFETR